MCTAMGALIHLLSDHKYFLKYSREVNYTKQHIDVQEEEIVPQLSNVLYIHALPSSQCFLSIFRAFL